MNRRPGKWTATGMSLIELLVVVAIISLLIGVSATVFRGLSGSKLTTAANLLADELELARQTAIARNQRVEFRIYQLPGLLPGSGTTPTVYRAFQAFRLDDADRATPIRKMVSLPEGVILATNGDVSTLLQTKNPPMYQTGTAAGVSLGAYPPSAYNYYAFRFKPDGSTELSPAVAQSWHATVIIETAKKDGPSGLPSNFCTVQIDPQTGRTRLYQPN